MAPWQRSATVRSGTARSPHPDRIKRRRDKSDISQGGKTAWVTGAPVFRLPQPRHVGPVDQIDTPAPVDRDYIGPRDGELEVGRTGHGPRSSGLSFQDRAAIGDVIDNNGVPQICAGRIVGHQ
jgi:hypothetical protein